MRTVVGFILAITPSIIFGQVRDDEKERQRIVDSNIKAVVQWPIVLRRGSQILPDIKHLKPFTIRRVTPLR
ncbi:MAG: hypothetical protein GX467_03710 [Rikenellaceae bacterium]|nr:hypothetical protein [Rikenellaceae bacterium]